MEWDEIRICLPRWQVYRRLRSLCNDSKGTFLIQGIQGPEQEDDLEAYVIMDSREKRPDPPDEGQFRFPRFRRVVTVPQEVGEKYVREGRVWELFLWGHPEERGELGVIGTVRLFDEGNSTIVRFVMKDARFHTAITDEGVALFRKFIQRVQDYFVELPKMMGKDGADHLPPVTDPTDQRILKWITDDPDLTDTQIGQRLGISRQAANTRRRRLEEMGYKVR